MSKYWDTYHETMSREQLAELQLKRLKALVERVYTSVPFYRQAFQEKVYPLEILNLWMI
ncbi:hypothetical protein N752_20720 [Desulforamulus aquiferis]|nr:hypothetical protein N752_20720 [Desulforamulus aquiferis]